MPGDLSGPEPLIHCKSLGAVYLGGPGTLICTKTAMAGGFEAALAASDRLFAAFQMIRHV